MIIPAAEFAFPGPLRDRLVIAILSGAKTGDTLGWCRHMSARMSRCRRSVKLLAVVDSADRRVAAIDLTEVRETGSPM